jgi:hypothetical protein
METDGHGKAMKRNFASSGCEFAKISEKNAIRSRKYILQ